MPDYVKSEILEKINSKELTLLSVDTCIFHENGYNLASGLLGNLSQFTKSHINIVLSDIVIREALAHMTSKIETPDAALNRAIKTFANARKIDPHDITDSVKKIVEETGAPNDIARGKFLNFMKRANIAEVKSEDFVLVKDVISDYFGQCAPFSNEKGKKHEFPDAFALHSLEAYAKQKGKLMLVVSNDGGWVDYCKKSQWLVCERTLDDAVRQFQHIPSIAAPILYQRLSRGDLPQLESCIEREITNYVASANICISAETSYGYDYDIEDIVNEILSYGDQKEFKLTFYDKNSAKYVFKANIDVNITIFVSFDFWSIMDGEHVGRGTAYVEESFRREASVVLEISGDLNENFDVSEVQVASLSTDFDFGYQEPLD